MPCCSNSGTRKAWRSQKNQHSEFGNCNLAWYQKDFQGNECELIFSNRKHCVATLELLIFKCPNYLFSLTAKKRLRKPSLSPSFLGWPADPSYRANSAHRDWGALRRQCPIAQPSPPSQPRSRLKRGRLRCADGALAGLTLEWSITSCQYRHRLRFRRASHPHRNWWYRFHRGYRGCCNSMDCPKDLWARSLSNHRFCSSAE